MRAQVFYTAVFVVLTCCAVSQSEAQLSIISQILGSSFNPSTILQRTSLIPSSLKPSSLPTSFLAPSAFQGTISLSSRTPDASTFGLTSHSPIIASSVYTPLPTSLIADFTSFISPAGRITSEPRLSLSRLSILSGFLNQGSSNDSPSSNNSPSSNASDSSASTVSFCASLVVALLAFLLF